MPNSSNPLNLVVSAMLAFIALPFVMIGLVGLVHVDELWWAYALLLGAGGVMVGGAISIVQRWQKALGEEERTKRAMVEAAQLRLESPAQPAALPAQAAPVAAAYSPEAPPAHPAEVARARPAASASSGTMAGPVLAHWTYQPDEWSAYARREAAYRGREALGVGVGVAALGTVLLGVTEGDWGIAFAVSAFIGGIIGVGRWLMSRAAYQSNTAARYGEAIIGPTAILLNGRYHVLQDRTFRFEGVKLLEHERPPIVEFTVTWPTRGGRTNEQYRVPIPAGKEEEARALVETFRQSVHGAIAR